MSAEKLNDVSAVATNNGREQGGPKASGLRYGGVESLSYFAAEARPRDILIFWKSQPSFLLSLLLIRCAAILPDSYFWSGSLHCCRYLRTASTVYKFARFTE